MSKRQKKKAILKVARGKSQLTSNSRTSRIDQTFQQNSQSQESREGSILNPEA